METIVLPHAFLSSRKKQELIRELNERLKNMTDAYCRLPFHLSEEAIPRNPKQITAERLAGYVEKMKEGLDEDSKEVWQKLYSDALTQIKVIRQFFEAFPDAEFDVYSNISVPVEKRITCKNKMECINADAMVDVPDECREYFDAVRNVEFWMQKVNEVERKNNIRVSDRYRIAEELTGLSENPVEFADTWLNDGFRMREQTLS